MRIAAMLAAVLLSVTGCASVASDGDRGVPAIDPLQAQAWALGDGVVTEDEYRTAVEKFRSCMKDSGYTVTPPVLSPIDGLTLLYDAIPTGDVKTWNVKIEECNLTTVSHVEPGYVESHTQVMDEKVRRATIDCLVAKGIKTSGTERNIQEFQAVAAKNKKETIMGCIMKSARDIYPDLPHQITVRY
jgi:hypothetical protein